MNKNSFLTSKLLRSNIALFSILCMIVGFLTSRAILSGAMMLYGLNALIGINPKRWFRNQWWLLGVIWVSFYLLSYFWSNDLGYWHSRCEVKLPVLLLPLAFAFAYPFNYRQLKIFTIVLCLAMFASVSFSAYFLLSDPDFYIKGYNYSHVLPTLPNDHISVSIAFAATVIWCVYFYKYVQEIWLKYFLIIVTLVLIFSLHTLAARTGLLAVYIFIIGWCIFLTVRKKTPFIGLSLLGLFLAFGVLAFSFIPTLKERMNHFNYTIIMFREGNMSGDYSDIGRYMSYDLAGKLMKKHPLKGVGAGNILDTMKGAYDKYYPQVPDEQRLIPHNQFLTVAVACGIPALISFILWIFYPLTKVKKNRSGFFFVMMWLALLIPLLVDPFLEIQFGVFVYLFFLLMMYKMMRQNSITISDNKE